MANIHSQKKRILRSERERLENRRYTSTIKTYFRSLDVMHTEAARFPLEVMSLLVQKTAALFPRGVDVTVNVTDRRGTDLTVVMPPDMVDRLLS